MSLFDEVNRDALWGSIQDAAMRPCSGLIEAISDIHNTSLAACGWTGGAVRADVMTVVVSCALLFTILGWRGFKRAAIALALAIFMLGLVDYENISLQFIQRLLPRGTQPLSLSFTDFAINSFFLISFYSAGLYGIGRMAKLYVFKKTLTRNDTQYLATKDLSTIVTIPASAPVNFSKKAFLRLLVLLVGVIAVGIVRTIFQYIRYY